MYLSINSFFNDIGDKLYQTFIEADRWKVFVDGLKITLLVTFFSVIIGIVLGFLIASIRATYDKTKPGLLLKILNAICKIYLAVIRGTPVLVQLMIIYFVIFASVDISKVVVAVIAFGINSGAYVAEIVRAGIMSIDAGQSEAGRSIGFTYLQTMRYVIMPQAFRNVLPALCNEFIVLLKETSVASYIALGELTKAGEIVKSQTYEPMVPLVGVAVIYLVMVLVFSFLVGKLERRLSNGRRK